MPAVDSIKAITSLRQWEHQTFRARRLMNLVVLATPEDIEANAEYIRLANEFVRVPGGDVKNNYANVELIANVAKRCQVCRFWF
jgi:acetyl-CoA carboxylase/biotin carboxylase 1